jgi:hypothetical protein
MQTNVQIDSKALRGSPDHTSVKVYDPRTKTMTVSTNLQVDACVTFLFFTCVVTRIFKDEKAFKVVGLGNINRYTLTFPGKLKDMF